MTNRPFSASIRTSFPEKGMRLSHVVILDIRMPNMDGLEALVALLGKNHTLPVILHSAYPEYKESFITAGSEAFVLKSPDLTELKRTIQNIVDRGIEGTGISAERLSKSGKRSP
jgi:CheY-like chemotaxis protein